MLSNTETNAGVVSTDAVLSSSIMGSSKPPTTTTVKAAVRVRPLFDTEAPPSQATTAPNGYPSNDSSTEVIRVVTAAGKLTRPMESAYMLEVLQPPLPSAQTTSSIAGVGMKAQNAPRGLKKAGSAGLITAKAYAFDYCAGPSTSQEELFTLLDIPAMCEAAMSGQVVTIFCFGQTGSGKTFTLSGRTLEEGEIRSPDGPLVSEDGLQYQAIAYVAHRLKGLRHTAKKQHNSLKRVSKSAATREEQNVMSKDAASSSSTATTTTTVIAKCSYVELYQETLYDLLQPESAETVKCRWSATAQSFYVEGSLLVECCSKDDFLMVLREGQHNRQRGSHALNRDSSRSHVVFTVFFDVCDGEGGHADAAEDGEGRAENGKDGVCSLIRSSSQPQGGGQREKAGSNRRHGRLVFVDLAGSERLKKSQSTSGAETGSINKSLFTLGHVLELLSAATTATAEERTAAKPPFIPYRSSVLTQLLMHSLDGHGRTLMIACVSPSALHLEESLRTLHYAQRARHIRTTPAVHVDAQTQQRMALEGKVAILQRENWLLRRALGLPRGSPLTEAEVQAQLEVLRRSWIGGPSATGSATITTAAAATPTVEVAKGGVSVPTKVLKSARSRTGAISSPVPPPATTAKKAAALSATPRAACPKASTGNARVNATNQGPPPSRPSPFAPEEEGEREQEEMAELPELPASGESVAPANILALLDALPDTRFMA